MRTEFLIAAAVMTGAGFFQGATGFGFGMVAMSVLPHFMEARPAVLYVSLAAPFVALRILYDLRRWVDLRRALPMLAGSMAVGMPLGVWFFVGAESPVLRKLVGGAVAAGAVLLLALGKRARLKLHPGWGFPAGVLSGLLGGACNVSGPPLILYLWMQGLKKEEVSSTLQTVFAAGALWKVALLLAWGQVDPLLGAEGACAGFAVLLSAGVGVLVFGRVPTEKLRAFTYAALVCLGFALLLAGA